MGPRHESRASDYKEVPFNQKFNELQVSLLRGNYLRGPSGMELFIVITCQLPRLNTK